MCSLAHSCSTMRIAKELSRFLGSVCSRLYLSAMRIASVRFLPVPMVFTASWGCNVVEWALWSVTVKVLRSIKMIWESFCFMYIGVSFIVLFYFVLRATSRFPLTYSDVSLSLIYKMAFLFARKMQWFVHGVGAFPLLASSLNIHPYISILHKMMSLWQEYNLYHSGSLFAIIEAWEDGLSYLF